MRDLLNSRTLLTMVLTVGINLISSAVWQQQSLILTQKEHAVWEIILVPQAFYIN